jgi:sugar lactone lactonase YvrE
MFPSFRSKPRAIFHPVQGTASHLKCFRQSYLACISILFCCFSLRAPAQGSIVSGPAASVNFGSRTIGTASSPVPVVFTFSATGSVGSVSVLTDGAAALDFANAGTGTCTTNGASHVYHAGDSCTVLVTFTASLTGLRHGAAILKDASGSVLAQGLVFGTGAGPQLNFLPGTESLVGSGWQSPGNMAVDCSGNLYVADGEDIYKETPSGSTYTQTTLLHLNVGIGGLAVDGGGNLFVAEDDGFLHKLNFSAHPHTDQVIGSGLYNPNGITLDTQGNVYIADAYNGRVLKETLNPDGSYTQSDILDCGFVGGQNCPSSVATDPSGNLYVTAYSNSTVLKLTPNGSAYSQSPVGSSLVWPSDVVSDSAGNLYIADTLNSRIEKIASSPSGTVQTTIATSPIDWPWGLAVDARGNVYVSDTYHHRVLKEDLWDPPALTFQETAIGKTSSDSPKTVTLLNAGTVPLLFPVPASGANPSLPANFTFQSNTAQACPVVSSSAANPGTLSANQTCNLAIDFSPADTNPDNAALLLKDNNLNAPAPAYATQSISLTISGNSTLLTSQTALTPASVTVMPNYQFILTAHVTGNGTVAPTGKVNFSGSGGITGTDTLDANGNAILAISLPNTGNYSVVATYTGDATYAASTSASASVLVTAPKPSTLTLSPATEDITDSQPVTITAHVTGNGTIVPTGYVNFEWSAAGPAPGIVPLDADGNAAVTLNMLNPGTYTFYGTYSGDGVYTSSSAKTSTYFVNSGPAVQIVLNGPSSAQEQYGSITPVSFCVKVEDSRGFTANSVVNFSGANLTISPKSVSVPSFSGSCTQVTPPSVAGMYTATASAPGVTGSISFTVQVVAANLTVKLKPSQRFYGAPNPTFSYTSTGLVSGDQVTITPSTTATQASPVGTYPVTATISGPDAAKYQLTVIPSTIYIHPANLTVAATSYKSVYGQAPTQPTGYTITGFVNGETQAVVSGTPLLSTTVTASTPVGSYPIQIAINTLYAPNYTFARNPSAGKVEVQPAPLDVTANNLTIQRGSSIPPLTYSLTGFVNGDTAASSVTGAPLLTTTATSASQPGTYPIDVYLGTLKAPNYRIVKVNGTLTITP